MYDIGTVMLLTRLTVFVLLVRTYTGTCKLPVFKTSARHRIERQHYI